VPINSTHSPLPETISGNRTTIHSLSILRGIAALMVCFFHVKKYIWRNEHPHSWTEWCEQGFMGVYIFFVISGFVIPYALHHGNYSPGKFKKFLMKRTLRIEPPYIIFLLLLFIWNYSLFHWKHIGTPILFDLKKFILNITYLAPFTGEKWILIIFWTLAIEFQFYLLMGFIYPLLLKNSLSRYLTSAIILSLGLIVPEKYLTIFNVYVFFFIGFQTFLHYCKRINLREYLITMFAALAFIWVWELNTIIPYVLFTVLGIYFLNYSTIVGDYLGKISYSLYLTHGLAGGAFAILTAGSFTAEIRFAGAIITSLLFAGIFYKLIEQPFLKWSKRIRY
jgi:peptidoglycan/LPS O-acetylase OafA/YrhL